MTFRLSVSLPQLSRRLLPLVANACCLLAPSLVLAQSPAPDDFDPGVSGGTDAGILAVALQADGKILAGGAFTRLGGQARANLGRLQPDGSLDSSFAPAADDSVNCLAVQTDGKILLGGNFLTLNGQPRSFLGRLNADGSVDTTFNPVTDSSVFCLAVQADGKILVGGAFNTLGGGARDFFGRLNTNGTLDTTFNPRADWFVNCLAVQADGRILAGGAFSALGGQPRQGLGRLNANGTLDATFKPGIGGPIDASVYSLAVQVDGKILVGGGFASLAGQPRANVGRLNSNGTLDTTFDPAAIGFNYPLVNSIVLQTDGRILVAGTFDTLGGLPRTNLGRLAVNGTIEEEFDPGASGAGPFPGVSAVAIQADGKVVVGGFFNTLGGQVRNHLARLNATGPAAQALTRTGSTLTWSRSGTGPELWRTTFEVTRDGLNWTNLGAGLRVTGGWEKAGVSIPTGSIFRARGFISASAGWNLEEVQGGPVVISKPLSRTNAFGTTAQFSVAGAGALPFTYQWLKDGQAMADQGNVAGATSSVLVLTGVSGADRGEYRAVVSNPSGSVTSTIATLVIDDPAILGHPMSSNHNPGGAYTFTVSAAGTAPLRYQWYRDHAAIPDATNASWRIPSLSKADSGVYIVKVTNPSGQVESRPAVLAVNTSASSLDTTFNPRANGAILAIAVQPDRKIVVGGGFTTLGGTTRNRLARLNPDGTLDEALNPGVSGGNLFGALVHALVVQPDGKILVGGDFSTVAGQPRFRLARLHADGTLDTAVTTQFASFVDFDTRVETLVLQPDGKILVGGVFEYINKTKRVNLGRLTTNGLPDGSFNPGLGNYDNGQPVYCMALQTNGSVLVGGRFQTLAKKPRLAIGRVNSKGQLDATFNPGADGDVYALAVQVDGKILVGGEFQTLGGKPRVGLGRLNPNGTIDPGFRLNTDGGISELPPAIYSLAIQTDGKILVGGNFTTLGGQSRRYIARINEDGTLDSTFAPGAGNRVVAVTVQPDGDILAGGNFSSLAGQARSGIGRLNNTDPAVQMLSYAGSTISWRHEGTGPAIGSATFEFSTNGVNWKGIGAGTRIVGGWQRTGVVLAAHAYLRARGLVAGGAQSASSWIVESYDGRPLFLSQPISRTNGATTTATFKVEARGSEPLAYQWFKNGLPLVDQANVMGANLPTLSVSNVLRADEGAFSVVASNRHGSVTSLVATLVVLNPRIIAQPVPTQRNVGESATFTVTAVGSPTPTIQWFHNGTPIPNATNFSLTVQNLTANHIGLYTVEVSNADGTLISEPALLEVNTATTDVGFTLGIGGGYLTTVHSVVVQPDQKVLVGGDFTFLGSETREGLGRLNPDGTVDPEFAPQADWYVFAHAVQTDGSILVGGGFSFLGDQDRSALGRLNPDGSLDSAFNPGVTGGDGLPGWEFGTDGVEGTTVYAVALQPDGKILLGGNFKTVAGTKRVRLARLNANGSVDPTFLPGASGGYLTAIRSIVLQTDQKILVAGDFTTLSGKARKYLGRLNPDGKLDSTFVPIADAPVYAVALQSDGRILVGGEFTTLSGQPRRHLARLNPDGTLDPSFNPGVNGTVYTLLVETNGGILIGGHFSIVGGRTRQSIARFHADETLDSSFNPGVSGIVYDLATQSDGHIVLGGRFSVVGGRTHSHIARLIQPALATRLLATHETTRGTRSGPGPLSLLPAATTIQEFNPGVQPSGSVQLQVVRQGAVAVLSWTGGQPPYQVQWTTDLSEPDSWQNLGEPLSGTSVSLPIGPGVLFLRVRNP